MLYSQEEILIELGVTIDQLLKNANILKQKDLLLLEEDEIDMLYKTQESLSEKFIHTKQLVQSKNKNREASWKKKLEELLAIDPSLANHLSEKAFVNCKPRIGRNRKKSKMGQFAYCQF